MIAGMIVHGSLRLTAADRDRIHKAAGPPHASRFIRAVAAAFAAEDAGALKAVLKEASPGVEPPLTS